MKINKTWDFEFINEWSQLFNDCHWYDMTLIKCSFTNDKMFGQYEFDFMIAGLGIYVSYAAKPMRESIDEWLNGDDKERYTLDLKSTEAESGAKGVREDL